MFRVDNEKYTYSQIKSQKYIFFNIKRSHKRYTPLFMAVENTISVDLNPRFKFESP